MSFILLLVGIALLICVFTLNIPIIAKYREIIFLVGVFLALWGLLGVFVDLLIGIIVFVRYAIFKALPFVFAIIITAVIFLLIHFKVIRL